MNHNDVIHALQLTGELLDASHSDMPVVKIILAGGAAAMIGGLLRPERTTGDCDVISATPEDCWDRVAAASAKAGQQLGLSDDWLNRKAQMWRHYLLAGWAKRCKQVLAVGPLEVYAVVNRVDLIAAKIMGAPKRVQDRDDLQDLAPTSDELRQIDQHLDRLETESLDRETFEPQRAYVKLLSSRNEDR